MTELPDEFTDDERRVVAYYLHRPPSGTENLMMYIVYLLPSVLFAAYALATQDFGAVLVAYLALLVVVLLYLGYARSTQLHLFSALRKYEQRVRALELPK